MPCEYTKVSDERTKPYGCGRCGGRGGGGGRAWFVRPMLWCTHMAYLRRTVDPKHEQDTVGKLRLTPFQRYTADFQTIRPKIVMVCEYAQVSDSLQALPTPPGVTGTSDRLAPLAPRPPQPQLGLGGGHR